MSTAISSRVKAACSCGKKYLVRAQFSGQKSKCQCGKFFTVPKQEKTESVIADKACPWCGARIGTEESDCKNCQDESQKRVDREASAGWWEQKENQIIGGICAATVVIAGICQTQLDGPAFLWFYLAIGVACCIGFCFARLTACTTAAFIMPLVAFEAIGVIRYGYGVTQGMDRFSILGMMMLFGPFVIAAIAFLDQFADSSRSGSNSWGCSCASSCGSSCGGGGCGGGGCGGCGN